MSSNFLDTIVPNGDLDDMRAIRRLCSYLVTQFNNL